MRNQTITIDSPSITWAQLFSKTVRVLSRKTLSVIKSETFALISCGLSSVATFLFAVVDDTPAAGLSAIVAMVFLLRGCALMEKGGKR